MPVYNVEIFTPDFTLICHDNISSVSYAEDYLSPVENSVTVLADKDVGKGDYIRISSKEEDYFGVVTSVDHGASDGRLMKVSYKPFTSLLNTDILFDTDLQGIGTMEDTIKEVILDNFVTNSDPYQNISVLGEINLLSKTIRWGLNLKSDTEGKHHCIVNFYNTFLVNAFEKYGIAVTVRPDFYEKKINLSIGTTSRAVITIESDLPNVIKKNIIIRKSSSDINKLTVYNDANYTEKAVFYLHPDGTYDQLNRSRMTPVVGDVQAATVEEGGTFAKAAASTAASVFGQIRYSNLIELTILKGDMLFGMKSYQFGQVVNIIHNGVSYASVFSGIDVGNTIKLVFGTIRLDLTKIIKKGI